MTNSTSNASASPIHRAAAAFALAAAAVVPSQVQTPADNPLAHTGYTAEDIVGILTPPKEFRFNIADTLNGTASVPSFANIGDIIQTASQEIGGIPSGTSNVGGISIQEISETLTNLATDLRAFPGLSPTGSK